ncbi:MAG: hypothetical protein HOM25_06060 [Rhodospirillaceae bacterium]|jgi:hypothetical protein|nr:hypothetical protein [Rhodospirillaceae bacterium]MBT5666892.1 hypothetical protein [Rhodospirillaceae bacterium]MBT5809570.1 hypothetical protein [Rhodospirillaceae bacterium]
MTESVETTRSGETEAVVVIKAAPLVGQRHGETVCCAGIDLEGNWLRLYPISFRSLDDRQQFGRWDRIRFRWRRPNDDLRTESRRVDQDTLEIVGELRKSERERFLTNSIVTSLDAEYNAGRSLALLKAQILEFKIESKTNVEIEEEATKFAQIRAQMDLFNAPLGIPYQPCPYRFKYKYRTEDGQREGTCQDWETEATFFNWEKRYGENQALENMQRTFGEEYPSKGMLLAMGTHSRHQNTWLINGVIRMDEIQQLSLF